MKKALIFDPYLDTLGGGERYTLTFAQGLLSQGYSVEIAWSDPQTLRNAEDRFGLDLSKIKINRKAFDFFSQKVSVISKFFFTIKYHLIFWVSDGSLPFLFAKKNYIHFQVPFKTIGGNSFINKLKTIFVKKFIYNSLFTAVIHEKHFSKRKSFILYPPIDTNSFKPENKENIILSVARFDSPSHPKRQDVLVDAFKKLYKSTKEYQMFLAGGVHGESESLDNLKVQSGNLPIKFIVNPNFDKLKSLYGKSKFFWHAAGYEIDEGSHPENVEHFGMTTAEAMSAGCVPIVIGKGGQKEILTNGIGLLCNNADEIASSTINLIKDNKLFKKIQEVAMEKSKEYSLTNFFSNQKKLL